MKALLLDAPVGGRLSGAFVITDLTRKKCNCILAETKTAPEGAVTNTGSEPVTRCVRLERRQLENP